MGWLFNKRKKGHQHSGYAADVEIIAHKQAAKEQVEKARAANEQLHELLVENGFTLKIYLAAGGNHPNYPSNKQ